MGASFGLHPEPASSLAAPRSAVFVRFQAAEAAHGCLACLTHGAALASPPSAVLLAGLFFEPASVSLESPSRGRLAGTELPGRSPPFERS